MRFNVTVMLSLALGLFAHTTANSVTKAHNVKVSKKSTTVASKSKKGGQRNVVVQQMRSPPPATLPNGHDTLLESGCLDPERIAQLKARFQFDIQPSSTWPVMQASSASACQPYSVAITTPMVRNTLVMISPGSTEGHTDALMFSRSAAGSDLSREASPTSSDIEVLRQITTNSLRPEGIDLQDIPVHLQWEVDLITKQMISALKVDPAAHHVRLTVTADANTGAEMIYAIELIESATGNRADIALWLERDNVPGAYFSMQGIDYERLLWKSPVQFTRISRGVGPSVTTVSRRVAVKSSKKAKARMVVRTFKVKGHHIGIDFAAPTGTPVVAVANGEVIHAGVNGGYGNLVIVDHGEGHHTYYAHLSAYVSDIKPGSLVRRGEEIGFVGSTGFSTGPHLHFEIRKEGLFIDPAVKENKLKFWTLDAQEQPQILARLVRLQMMQPTSTATSKLP